MVKMGTVMRTGYDDGTQKVHTVYLNLMTRKQAKNRIRKSCDLYARQNHFVPITRIVSKIRMRANSPSSPEIQRAQFPPTYRTWACTIHKVQGFNKAKLFLALNYLDRNLLIKFTLH